MAGFGDAFVNAYNAAQANTRANNADDRAAEQFKWLQQEHDDQLATAADVKAAAQQTHQLKKGVSADDVAHDTVRDPTPDVTPVTAPTANPVTAPTPSPLAAPQPATSPTTAGLPTHMNLPAPGQPLAPAPAGTVAGLPTNMALPNAPAGPVGTAPDGVDNLTGVAVNAPKKAPVQALPPQQQMGDTAGLSTALPDATVADRVPVSINGQTKYVDPSYAVEMTAPDRFLAMSDALARHGHAQEAATLYREAQAAKSGDMEMQRKETQSGILQSLNLGDTQQGWDALTSAINNGAPNGHTIQATKNADGSTTLVDLVDGHRVNNQTLPPGSFDSYATNANAVAGDPDKYMDYRLNVARVRTEGISNAISQAADAREQALQPGKIKLQKAQYDQAEASADASRASAEASRSKAATPWENKTVTDPTTGVQTTFRVSPDGLNRQVLAPGIGYVDDKQLTPDKLASMQQVAKDNGWTVAADQNGNLGFHNPTQPGWEAQGGAFSTDPSKLKSNKAPAQQDNNGAARIVKKLGNIIVPNGSAFAGGNVPVGLVK